MKRKLILYFFSVKNKIPEYLLLNLEYLTKFKCDIYFLTNVDIIIENVNVVKIFEINENLKYLESDNVLWRYSIDRFFSIRDFLKETEFNNVLYLESDVLLLKSPEYIYKNFCFGNKIIACQDSSLRAIPSIIFIPSYKSIREFCNFILDTNKKNGFINDMSLLGIYKNKNYFPVLPFNKKGIFDAAAIGQFLYGTDKYDKPGFINETSILKCNEVQFIFVEDRIYIENIEIMNLHFHNKNELIKYIHQKL